MGMEQRSVSVQFQFQKCQKKYTVDTLHNGHQLRTEESGGCGEVAVMGS